MPKIKMISRNPEDYTRETKKDIFKVQRNYDPVLHPFEAAREYTRALNSAKLERVFAKPFLGSLDGHRDSVYSMCNHSKSLSISISAGCDGQVRIWNLPKKQCIQCFDAHEGIVRGVCCEPNGEHIFTCGDDKTVKQWKVPLTGFNADIRPVNTYISKKVFLGISHHQQDSKFATCGDEVHVWDVDRAEPVRSFSWGVDSITSLRFNPIDTNILGATGSDRSIILYDMRGTSPLRKVLLKLRSNAMAWNPLESFVFTVANDDYNLYTFDMRKLDTPVNVHMDHVLAVTDVHYSPTGKEIVSGSFDKTVRVFPIDKGRSREVYHTKRMQRVNSVLWSLDNKYILSASDEMNIRIWKSNASDKLGVLVPREKVAFNYSDKLKEKFSQHPQVRRILRHRHVPKMIISAKKELDIIKTSKKRKLANKRIHSKPGTVPHVPERKKPIVTEIK